MICLPKTINFDRISFSKLQTLKNGTKSVYINHKDDSVVIQTPKMSAPFPLSKYKVKGAGDVPDVEPGTIEKLNLNLALNVENKSVESFVKFLKELEICILDAAMTNRMEWFKEAYEMDTLKELFTPLIQYPRDPNTGEIIEKYSPTFKVGVQVVKDGNILCECFDASGTSVELETVSKGSQVNTIIKCQGIWFAGGKFGCSWKVIQLRVEPPAGIDGYSFDDDNDEDARGESNIVESSDDEEEEIEFRAVEDDEDGHEDTEKKGDEVEAASKDLDEEPHKEEPNPVADDDDDVAPTKKRSSKKKI
jgi:hypothetical protein